MIAQLILTAFLLGILLYALTEYRRSPAYWRGNLPSRTPARIDRRHEPTSRRAPLAVG